MTKTETNLDWDEILNDLRSQEWQDSEDGGKERFVFIGTVFSLYPSGKYYEPWACSNLDVCSNCNGKGTKNPRKKRLYKKWRTAQNRCHAMADKLNLNGNLTELQKHGWYRYYRTVTRSLQQIQLQMLCRSCGGMGSQEAHADSLYDEALHEEAASHGLFVISGEGDPCDILVGESIFEE